MEAEVRLTGNEWQKHPVVDWSRGSVHHWHLHILRRGYFKDPKRYRWDLGVAALEMEEMEQLSALPGLSKDPSVVGLLKVKEQQVPIATATVHRWQYRANRERLSDSHP